MIKKTVKKFYIITTSDFPDNTLFRHASFIKAAGFEPVFVFPLSYNEKNFKKFYSNYKTVRLNFKFNSTGILNYSRSIILLFIYVTCNFLFQRKAKNFLAIDLQGTIACIFLKLRNVNIYTLVNDNFSARYNFSKRIYYILRSIESFIFKFISDCCIFPDKIRYKLLGSPRIKKVYYIPNILPYSLKSFYYKGSNTNKLKVLFCGWLVGTRGLELLSKILENTNDKIDFILAGSGNQILIDSLATKKRIKYIGHLRRDQILNLMTKVDINIAFYNPSILINRFALPQKIYDSLIVGCPLLINSEVKLSNKLLKSKSCFVVKYFDILKICSKLNELVQDKTPLIKMSKTIKAYCKQHINHRQIELIGQNFYRQIIKK
jgi:hypothetical protein